MRTSTDAFQKETSLSEIRLQTDLYRIGDAVSSRNTHAAIHDALRLGILW